MRRALLFKKPDVKTRADEFVESFLKPHCIKEPPKDYQWNYVVDIFTKWLARSDYFFDRSFRALSKCRWFRLGIVFSIYRSTWRGYNVFF
jgi:hypothetical protein